MTATKPIPVVAYRIAIAILTVALTASLAMVVFTGGSATKPISLARVTSAVGARFGIAYDWQCQIQAAPQRTVICRSQPNGFYSATYFVKADGTPVLETYVPPPS